MGIIDEHGHNPHAAVSLQRLYTACRSRARELCNQAPRQWEIEFARDTAHLLLAAAERFDFTVGPELLHPPFARQRDFILAFDEMHDRTQRDARYRTVLSAATAVHGPGAIDWLSVTRIGGKRVYDIALSDDEGLKYIVALLARRYT